MVLAATSVTSPKCLQDPLLALREAMSRKPREWAARRDGGRQAPEASGMGADRLTGQATPSVAPLPAGAQIIRLAACPPYGCPTLLAICLPSSLPRR
jgi:hypothetical protein